MWIFFAGSSKEQVAAEITKESPRVFIVKRVLKAPDGKTKLLARYLIITIDRLLLLEAEKSIDYLKKHPEEMKEAVKQKQYLQALSQWQRHSHGLSFTFENEDKWVLETLDTEDIVKLMDNNLRQLEIILEENQQRRRERRKSRS